MPKHLTTYYLVCNMKAGHEDILSMQNPVRWFEIYVENL